MNLAFHAARLEIEIDALRRGIEAHPDLEPTPELAETHARALAVLTGAQLEILRASASAKAPMGALVGATARPSERPRSVEALVEESLLNQARQLEAAVRALPKGLQKLVRETRIELVVPEEAQTPADRERPPAHAPLVRFRPSRGDPDRQGQLLGWTSRGQFVVEAEGQQFSVWQVEHLGPVEWPTRSAAIESVPRAFRSRPHGRYRELLEHALDRPVCGEHTAREFMNALGEVFMVGGSVRDAILHAASAEMAEGFKSKRADVDLVTTETPFSVIHTGRRIARDVKGRKGEPGGLISDELALSQGTVRFANAEDTTSPGLDISVIHVRGMFESGARRVAGSDLFEDALARDFTCNAVYYDPVSGLLLDPTGHGIRDAEDKRLRIPSDRYVEENHSYALRFAKLRLKGFEPERETLEAMKKNARRFFGKEDIMINKLARLVPSTHQRRGAIDSWLGELVGKLQGDGFVREGKDGSMDAARLLRPLSEKVIQACFELRRARQQV